MRAPVPRLMYPTMRSVRPGMSTNKGQLSPASKPVNWINKANRPKTTSTTPHATLDPARRVVDPGATYAGGRGWYAGGGSTLTAVSVATASVGWSSLFVSETAPIDGDSSLSG